MKIRNEGKAKIYFNGGILEPNSVVEFTGNAEKIGAALLMNYPFLVNLDSIKPVKVTTVVTDEKESLVAEAKKLGVKGNVEGMKVETLKAKIAALSN